MEEGKTRFRFSTTCTRV